MDFKTLGFYRQKIIANKDCDQDAYELLLREIDGQENRFPKATYEYFIRNSCSHVAYIRWLDQTLMTLLKEEPLTHYSLNLDHQELEYPETFALLEALEPYHKRLSIEITEVPAYQRKVSYFKTINVAAFERIAALGYQIALDDVTQGMNSLGNLLMVQPYISRVKFSLVHFKGQLNEQLLEQLLLLLVQICQTFHKELVIEGVEDEATANWLIRHQITLHQGYYYDYPSPLPHQKEGEKS